MAHMVGMCDRRIRVHENTGTVTVYSKATVGQTAMDLAVDVEAPAEPDAAPEEATATAAAAEPDQDLVVLDAKIIDCVAQGMSGYIPIAQTIGTTRDTVEHRMKAMLADGRLMNRRDADGSMMPGLPLPTSPAPAPAPARPVMPEGLTMEDQIRWRHFGRLAARKSLPSRPPHVYSGIAPPTPRGHELQRS